MAINSTMLLKGSFWYSAIMIAFIYFMLTKMESDDQDYDSEHDSRIQNPLKYDPEIENLQSEQSNTQRHSSYSNKPQHYEHSQMTEVVDSINLDRYQGQWYVISYLPNIFEANCYCNTKSLSLISQNEFQIIDSCRRGSSQMNWDKIKGTIKVQGDTVSNQKQLAFSYFPGDVVQFDLYENDAVENNDSGQYFAIGSINKKKAYILSQSCSLETNQLVKIQQLLQNEGYEVEKMISPYQGMDCEYIDFIDMVKNQGDRYFQNITLN